MYIPMSARVSQALRQVFSAIIAGPSDHLEAHLLGITACAPNNPTSADGAAVVYKAFAHYDGGPTAALSAYIAEHGPMPLTPSEQGTLAAAGVILIEEMPKTPKVEAWRAMLAGEAADLIPEAIDGDLPVAIMHTVVAIIVHALRPSPDALDRVGLAIMLMFDDITEAGLPAWQN